MTNGQLSEYCLMDNFSLTDFVKDFIYDHLNYPLGEECDGDLSSHSRDEY